LPNAEITIEKFHQTYREYVLKWIEIQNNTWSNFFVEQEDFYSLVIDKLFIQKKISQFNPNHSSKSQFKTWLNMFLKNLHIDNYRKKSLKSLDQLIEENGDYILDIEQDTFETPENIFDSDTQILVQAIISGVNTISKLRDRILVKLKLFIEHTIEFDSDEIEYLCANSGLSESKVLSFLKENIKKDGFGIRDKDIEKLTDFATGSINTTYQRIVRKMNLNSYSILND